MTNCYFIKAELYRINNKLNKAEEYYNHCFEICRQNGDKDILYLIAYTYKAVKLSKNYTLKIKFDWDKYLEECKQSEEYKFHQRLISKLEIATLNIENLNIWKDQYDKTINPIP